MKTLFFFLVINTIGFTQTIKHFDIKIGDSVIGHLQAQETLLDGNRREVLVESKTQVNFIVFKLNIIYKSASMFTNGILTYSKVISKTNRGFFDAETKYLVNCYHIKANRYKEKAEKTLNTVIYQTVSNLYFNEPRDLQQKIYSEFNTEFFEINKLKPAVYELISTKSHDVYYYNNGILQKIIKKNPIKDFEIVLKN